MSATVSSRRPIGRPRSGAPWALPTWRRAAGPGLAPRAPEPSVPRSPSWALRPGSFRGRRSHPSEASLTLAIVGVQFFGLSRGFLRYGERLVGHDAALRVLGDLRVARLRAARSGWRRPGCPSSGGATSSPGSSTTWTRCRTSCSGSSSPSRSPPWSAPATVAVMWILPLAPALVLLVALARRGHPRALAHGAAGPAGGGTPGRRPAASSARRWSTSMEGAAELTVLGGTAEQVERIAEADRPVAGHGSPGRGHRRPRPGPDHGTGRAGQLGGADPRRARHPRRHLDGALLAVLALVPLAAFELVSPLPAGTQALAACRTAAGRVFAAMDAAAPVEEPETPLTAAGRRAGSHSLVLRGGLGRIPRHRAGRAARGRPRPHSGTAGRPGRAQRSRASPPWPTSLSASCPLDAGEATLDGVPLERLTADEVRRVVGLVEQSPHLFDTSVAENLRIGRRERHATTISAPCWPGSAWAIGWPACPADWPPESGRAGPGSRGGNANEWRWLAPCWPNFSILVLDEPAEHLDPAAADALTADLLAPHRGSLDPVRHPPPLGPGTGRRDRRPRRGTGRRAGKPR